MSASSSPDPRPSTNPIPISQSPQTPLPSVPGAPASGLGIPPAADALPDFLPAQPWSPDEQVPSYGAAAAAGPPGEPPAGPPPGPPGSGKPGTRREIWIALALALALAAAIGAFFLLRSGDKDNADKNAAATTSRSATSQSADRSSAPGSTGPSASASGSQQPSASASSASGQPDEPSAIASQLFGDLTDAWATSEKNSDYSIAGTFIGEHNHPQMQTTVAQCVSYITGSPSAAPGTKFSYTPDLATLSEDPGWALPGGPVAGTVPAGTLYKVNVLIEKYGSSGVATSTTQTLHFAVHEGKHYMFFTCG